MRYYFVIVFPLDIYMTPFYRDIKFIENTLGIDLLSALTQKFHTKIKEITKLCEGSLYYLPRDYKKIADIFEVKGDVEIVTCNLSLYDLLSTNKKPSYEEILLFLYDRNIEMTLCGGFHYDSCVKNCAEYLRGKGISTEIVPELTNKGITDEILKYIRKAQKKILQPC